MYSLESSRGFSLCCGTFSGERDARDLLGRILEVRDHSSFDRQLLVAGPAASLSIASAEWSDVTCHDRQGAMRLRAPG